MRILVINISLRPNAIVRFLPIGLGYVASAVKRAGFDLDLLDLDAHPRSPEETEQFLCAKQYDVVAMGCIVTGYKYVKWICKTIKDAHPNTVIIVGNTVAQSIPEILLTKTEADIAVMGEGDELIVEILERLRTSRDVNGIKGLWYRQNQKISRNPSRPLIENIDAIPFPNWDLFDIELYIQSMTAIMAEPLPPLPREQIRVMTMNTARGCPHACTFCYNIFRGQKYRCRSAESIIKEMTFLHERYGINVVTFHDELTFFSIRQVQMFLDALSRSGLKVYWKAEGRNGLFCKDEHVDLVRQMKEAGCLCLGFSLESADPEILKRMNKRASVEEFRRQARIVAEAGLAVGTSIVIGYPEETVNTIKRTIDCCIETNIYPSAGYLLPQPGSPMYSWAIEKGYIKDEEEYLLSIGDRQDLHLNMTHMSDEQLRNTVESELQRCSHELGMGLSPDKLLKTGSTRFNYLSSEKVAQ